MAVKLTREDLFRPQGISNVNDKNKNIYVVIAKPTRVCNADCSYCSSPPLEEMGENWEPEWNFEKFKIYFDKVFPYMVHGATWIWHGGEPMLMGVDFYKKTYEYAKEKMLEAEKQIFFSMQSNMLGYNEKWKEVFFEIFGGSLSSSFDPDEKNRTIKGNAQNYSRVFKRALDKMMDDGFMPMVIGTYKEDTAHMMLDMYNWSLNRGERSFPLRFNYCVPIGREAGELGDLISPETYADNLVRVYNQWIEDAPNFTITPLDQMLKKAIGQDGEGHCPWMKSCGGKFINIEPNGEVYNCSEFSDLNSEYCFGNLNINSMEDILTSEQIKLIKKRTAKLPLSCMTCEHFSECEGGCARDSVLFDNGLYGKFYYCQSWKMVYARIKESVLLGQADKILEKMNVNIEQAKYFIKTNLNNHFSEIEIDWADFNKNGLNSKFGFAENNKNKQLFYDEKGRNKNIDYDKNENIFLKEEENKKIKINRKLSKIKVVAV